MNLEKVVFGFFVLLTGRDKYSISATAAPAKIGRAHV